MEKIKNAVDQLKPQFHVEHRIKEVFGTEFKLCSLMLCCAHAMKTFFLPPDNPEIRSFSLGMAAEQVSRSEQKLDKTLQSLVLCDILETRSDDPAESTENLLGDLHYRVNDTLLASCNASGLLTPGDHSREPSRSRASSPSFRLPSGLLTPGDHSREPSRSRPSSPSVHRNSEGHEGRRGTRPTGSSWVFFFIRWYPSSSITVCTPIPCTETDQCALRNTVLPSDFIEVVAMVTHQLAWVHDLTDCTRVGPTHDIQFTEHDVVQKPFVKI